MLSSSGVYLLFELPPLLSPKYGTMIWTVITFVCLLIVLAKFAWKPLLTALDNREKKIEEALERSETLKGDAERLLREYEEKMRAANEEVSELLEKGKQQAGAMKNEILDKARGQAQDTLDRARREIELAQHNALAEIRKETVDLTVKLASKVIERTLNASDHEELVREAMKDVKV